jgi:hypothetical protein
MNSHHLINITLLIVVGMAALLFFRSPAAFTRAHTVRVGLALLWTWVAMGAVAWYILRVAQSNRSATSWPHAMVHVVIPIGLLAVGALVTVNGAARFVLNRLKRRETRRD